MIIKVVSSYDFIIMIIMMTIRHIYKFLKHYTRAAVDGTPSQIPAFLP